MLYNADETGLIYKNLNSKTLVSNLEKSAPGRKTSKERITLMGCINATGQHKLPLMIIGNLKIHAASKMRLYRTYIIAPQKMLR